MPRYGVPAVQDPARTALGFVLGMVTMVVLGAALGLASRTARSAQAPGMLAFCRCGCSAAVALRSASSDTMRTVSDLIPLSHVTAAIREPWLDMGTGSDHLLVLSGWLAAGLIVVTLQLRRRPD